MRFPFPEDYAAVLIYISRGHALCLSAKGKEYTNFHLEAQPHFSAWKPWTAIYHKWEKLMFL